MSLVGDTAGRMSLRFEHVTVDDWGAKVIEVSVRSMAVSLVGASHILSYGSPRCIVALLTDPLSVSVQMSVPDTPPKARGRRLE